MYPKTKLKTEQANQVNKQTYYPNTISKVSPSKSNQQTTQNQQLQQIKQAKLQ